MNFHMLLVILTIVFLAGCAALYFRAVRHPKLSPPPGREYGISRRDGSWMLLITVIYAAVAFFQLGGVGDGSYYFQGSTDGVNYTDPGSFPHTYNRGFKWGYVSMQDTQTPVRYLRVIADSRCVWANCGSTTRTASPCRQAPFPALGRPRRWVKRDGRRHGKTARPRSL